MSSDNEVEVVVTWYVPLKQSPIYVLSAKEIFSGKAHEAPPIDKKRMMLIDIVDRPSEEYFLRGSQQAKDFCAAEKAVLLGLDDRVRSRADLDSAIHLREARSPARYVFQRSRNNFNKEELRREGENAA